MNQRPGGSDSSNLRVVIWGTFNGRDFVPSRKHSQEHFSTDSTAPKWKAERVVMEGSGGKRPACIRPGWRDV